jgi:hypothetical protein
LKIEMYDLAASSALLSNHKNGVIFCMMVLFVGAL